MNLDEIPLHRVPEVVLESDLRVLVVVLGAGPDLTVGYAVLRASIVVVPSGLAASQSFIVSSSGRFSTKMGS